MHRHDKQRSERFTLGNLVTWCNASTELTGSMLKRKAGTIQNDSRLIAKGDIFLALATENNDGHQFIESAFKAGAQAAIAARGAHFTVSKKYANRILYVKDPLVAVQKAARKYREELGILMVGVTGSSGKTTTRSFISQVLRQVYAVGETWSNWNNHIGVPLSILKFDANEWLGVIEMGANHTGEIHTLSKISKPDIGVITNIGYAHVGLFGSLAKTTEAKFEITDGLERKKGFLLLNGDDPRLVAEAKKRGVRAALFGFSPQCGIRAENVVVDPKKGVSFTVDNVAFTMQMPGRHFIYSALPAIFLGRRCGIPDELIAQALASIAPVAMRGTLEQIGTTEVIVDCYNANPSSMKSALTYLDDVAGRRRKVAILGEMLELGRYSRKSHSELGSAAASSGVDRLIAVGPSAARIAEGAISQGMKAAHVKCYASAHDVIVEIDSVVKSGDTVLLKGSRGMHLEVVYEHMKMKKATS